MRNGLGYSLDMSAINPLFGIDSQYGSQAEVFTGPGSFWHVLEGIFAGVSPAPWSLAFASIFFGYELSKAACGKPWSEVAGGMLEYSVGLLIAGLIGGIR